MSTALLLVSNDDQFVSDLKAVFLSRHPDIDIFLPGEDGAEQAEVAACWYPDSDLLTRYANIKCLHSVAAGVDHLGEALLASGLPICRVVDDLQKQGMFEYVLWGVLNMHRNFDKVRVNQLDANWQPYPKRLASEVYVGVLGLGELGQFVAQGLAAFGYSVSGWSRSQKNLDNIDCYTGSAGLNDLLTKSEVLVNLLPLSSETKGILNKDLFNTLPAGGYVINCGRGGHLVNGDLIEAIEKGQLRGALLDVFDEEPLPKSDPLWGANGVVITPHIASDASLATIIDQVADNALRFLANDLLINKIDPVNKY